MQTVHRTSHSTAQAPPPECVADRMARLIDRQPPMGVAIAGRGQWQAEGDQALTSYYCRRHLMIEHGNRGLRTKWATILPIPTAPRTRDQVATWVNEGGAGVGFST